MRSSLGAAVVCAVLLVPTAPLHAQRVMLTPTVSPPPSADSPPLTVVAGPEYAAGPAWRWLFGSLYRELWTAPITVPVLDPSRYRGGLHPVRVGGGFQTVTLHLRDASGRYYLFRSIDKLVNQGLGPDLRATPLGAIVQDQTKAIHPVGEWAVWPILEAVGIPYSRPELYVMADDPILGDAREQFAGLLGMLVESPDDGPEHTLRFQGSDRVLGSEDLLEELQKGPASRVDARAFLTARLVDFLVGDSDRGFTQWRWLGFRTDSAWSWKPSPLDRDAAFLMGDGVAGETTRRVLPKYVRFDEPIDVAGLTASQPEPDRLLLAELDRAAWDSVAASVQAAVTDEVIARSVAALPEPYRTLNGGFLARRLAARRAELPDAAARYYGKLARDVDVLATDADEVALVQRDPDGSVTVELFGPPRAFAFAPPANPAIDRGTDDREVARAPDDHPDRPYYRRRFVPEETNEVRIYLRGGADRAVVRGADSKITVRVIGGPGNDALYDSTTGSSEHTRFYDWEGSDRLEGTAGAHADRRTWQRTAWSEYQLEHHPTNRDFGVSRPWVPSVEYESGPGVIVGLARQRTDYGFRRLPYARRVEGGVRVGVENGGLGGELQLRQWRENSPLGVRLDLQGGWKLWSARFNGFGNDVVERDTTTTAGDQIVAGGYLQIQLGELGSLGWLSIGPELRWTDPRASAGSALAIDRPLGWTSFGSAALAAELRLDRTDRSDLPHRGVSVRATASVSPSIWDAPGWYGGVHAHGFGYLPLAATTLVFRGGAEWAWGDYPFQSAAYVGGGRTVRGLDFNRYGGDAALNGGLEWQLPLTRLTLLTRGDFGVMVLTDAGRVWLDGDSSGGWHGGAGGGLWYRTLGIAASATVAYAQSTKFYFDFKAPSRLTNLVQPALASGQR